MTDIYIDSNKIDFEDTELDATVAELVLAVEGQLREHRRFVAELFIDGVIEPDFRSESVGCRFLHKCAEVKLVSSTVESIALEGIDVLERYLNVVLENIGRCSEAFRTGSSPVGASSIVVIDGMTEIAKTMFELSKGGKNFDIAIFKTDPSLFYTRILTCLESLNSAKEAVDSVLMADVLEYELKELVEEMLGALFSDNKN